MSNTDQYHRVVRDTFPQPSPAMRTYLGGLEQKAETEVDFEQRQGFWDALSEAERDTCRALAERVLGHPLNEAAA